MTNIADTCILYIIIYTKRYLLCLLAHHERKTTSLVRILRYGIAVARYGRATVTHPNIRQSHRKVRRGVETKGNRHLQRHNEPRLEIVRQRTQLVRRNNRHAG